MNSRFVALVFLILLTSDLSGQSGTRKALIIGNNSYSDGSNPTSPFASLRGAPVNDANAVENAFEESGVQRANIKVLFDLKRDEFYKELYAFRNGLTDKDQVIFYFSGHGFSLDGQDYLVPLGFILPGTKSRAESTAIPLRKVLDILSKAPSRVIILDACRTEVPFLKGSSSGPAGSTLGSMPLKQTAGSLVAYSSSGGAASRADSPGGGLSYFTYYLVKALAARPSNILEALNRAQSLTSQASANAQVPAIYNEMPFSSDQRYTLGESNGFTDRRPRDEENAPLNLEGPARSLVRIDVQGSYKLKGNDLLKHWQNSGTGFIVDPQSRVVTALHLIDKAWNQRELERKVLSEREYIDPASLTIDSVSVAVLLPNTLEGGAIFSGNTEHVGASTVAQDPELDLLILRCDTDLVGTTASGLDDTRRLPNFQYAIPKLGDPVSIIEFPSIEVAGELATNNPGPTIRSAHVANPFFSDLKNQIFVLLELESSLRTGANLPEVIGPVFNTATGEFIGFVNSHLPINDTKSQGMLPVVSVHAILRMLSKQ